MSRGELPGRSPRRTIGLPAVVIAAAVVLASCSTGGDRTNESTGGTAGSSAAVSSAVSSPAASSAGVAGGAATGSAPAASGVGSDQPAEPGTSEQGGAGTGGSPAAQAQAPAGAESAPAGETPSSVAPVPAAPAATTPVAPPTAGDINQAVPDQPVTTLPPVPVAQAGDFGTGVTAAVQSLERIDAVGQGPGERSGPALSYRISLTNGTNADLDLSTVSVNVQDAAGTPFSPVDSEPAAPFTGALAPGQAASATYVFTLPSDYTAPATLSLAYTASAPIVLFAGDAQ